MEKTGSSGGQTTPRAAIVKADIRQISLLCLHKFCLQIHQTLCFIKGNNSCFPTEKQELVPSVLLSLFNVHPMCVPTNIQIKHPLRQKWVFLLYGSCAFTRFPKATCFKARPSPWSSWTRQGRASEGRG